MALPKAAGKESIYDQESLHWNFLSHINSPLSELGCDGSAAAASVQRKRDADKNLTCTCTEAKLYSPVNTIFVITYKMILA